MGVAAKNSVVLDTSTTYITELLHNGNQARDLLICGAQRISNKA